MTFCLLLALFEMCTSADHVQLWQDLLELRCPPPVEQVWHRVVEKIVTERVKRLNLEERIDMLCELEGGSSASSSCILVTNIFITESITALEELVFSQVSLITGISVNCQMCYYTFNLLLYLTQNCYNTRSIEKIMTSKSARVIDALGSILKRKYPNFSQEGAFSLKNLLEWDLWPVFINSHGI